MSYPTESEQQQAVLTMMRMQFAHLDAKTFKEAYDAVVKVYDIILAEKQEAEGIPKQ